MSLRPTGLILVEDDGGGVFTVIDDGPEFNDVLLIPGSFNHRRVVPRADLPRWGELHPAALVLDEQAIERAARLLWHWDDQEIATDWDSNAEAYRHNVRALVAALRNEQEGGHAD